MAKKAVKNKQKKNQRRKQLKARAGRIQYENQKRLESFDSYIDLIDKQDVSTPEGVEQFYKYVDIAKTFVNKKKLVEDLGLDNYENAKNLSANYDTIKSYYKKVFTDKEIHEIVKWYHNKYKNKAKRKTKVLKGKNKKRQQLLNKKK